MSLAKYAFVNARIGGMKSYLLDSGVMRGIIDTPNFDHALSMVKEYYGKELSDVSGPDIFSIEKGLHSTLFRDYDKIIKSIENDDVQRFFLSHLKRFEISSLKMVITVKLARSKKIEHPLIVYKTMPEETIEKLLTLETLGDIVEALKLTEYYELLKRLLEEHKENSLPLHYLTALDKYYYDQVFAALSKLDKEDNKIAMGFLGPEIDLANLSTILRLGKEKEGEEYIRGKLLNQRYNLRDPHISTLIKIIGLGELPSQEAKILEEGPRRPGAKLPYADKIGEALRNGRAVNLQELELHFKKKVLSTARSAFKGDRFNVGIPLAYLYLKENEIKNLVAILKGKEAGIASSKIGELVALS